MALPPKPPHVVFRINRQGDVQIMAAFLLRTPDGRYWAFPEAAAHERYPFLATAYPLDPSQLEEQPSTDPERQMFLYRVVVNVPR
jgi:hypothetical protein